MISQSTDPPFNYSTFLYLKSQRRPKKDGAVSWGAAAAYRLARRDAAALFK
jgi:hypothetical protein